VELSGAPPGSCVGSAGIPSVCKPIWSTGLTGRVLRRERYSKTRSIRYLRKKKNGGGTSKAAKILGTLPGGRSSVRTRWRGDYRRAASFDFLPAPGLISRASSLPNDSFSLTDNVRHQIFRAPEKRPRGVSAIQWCCGFSRISRFIQELSSGIMGRATVPNYDLFWRGSIPGQRGEF